jgi:hypothetical protein
VEESLKVWCGLVGLCCVVVYVDVMVLRATVHLGGRLRVDGLAR